MEPMPAAPEWVTKRVLPQVVGHVRSLQMVNPRTAIVLSHDRATVAQKSAFGGVKVYTVSYPAGFIVNESRCPHCHEILLEPVAKIARLAKGDAHRRAAEKTGAQRRQAAGMRTIRERSQKSKGPATPIEGRSAAKEQRRKLGVKKS